MFDDDFLGNLDLFQGDCSVRNYFDQSIMMGIVCKQARSTIERSNECSQSKSQVNIDFQKWILSKKLTACEESIGQIAYVCKTCRRFPIPVYICKSCFQIGEHALKNHQIQIIELPKQLVGKLQCHCGDFLFWKQNGTCANHNCSSFSINQVTNQEHYLKYKQIIIDCFKILFELQSNQRAYPKNSDLSNLYKQYQYQMINGLCDLVSDPNKIFFKLVCDCLSTCVSKILANGKEEKNIIIIHFLTSNITTTEFYELFNQIIATDEFFITQRVYNYLSNSYIKLLQDKQQNKNSSKQQFHNLQKLLNQFIIGISDCKRISQLAISNGIPNINFVCIKSYRIAAIKFYSFISKSIIINKIKNIQFISEIFQKLNKHKLLFLGFIQASYLPYVLLCSTSDQQSILQLLRQIQRILTSKNTYDQNLLQCICQVFLISIIEYKNRIYKYFSNKKLTALANLIKKSQKNPHQKGKIYKNLTNCCFKIKQILQMKNQLQYEQQKLIDSQQFTEPQVNSENIIMEAQVISNQVQQKTTTILADKIQNNAKNQIKKIKSQKEILIQKKKIKLQQKFSNKGQAILQRFKIQQKKQQIVTCGICREQHTENKALFMVGQVYKRNPLLSQILKIINDQKYCIDICKHTFHIECVLNSYKSNYTLSSKCPLCKQSINIGFLDTQLTEKGQVQFIQMLNLSKQFQNKQTYNLFPDLFYAIIYEKYDNVILGQKQKQVYQNQKQNNQTMFNITLNTLKQLYSRFDNKIKKQVEQKIIKSYEILCIRNKFGNQILNNIFAVIVLTLLFQITKNQQLLKLIKLKIDQLCLTLNSQQIYRIILSLPQTFKTKLNQLNKQILNQNSKNIKIIDLLCKLPKNITLLYNKFKSLCMKNRKHIDHYYYCLLCDKFYCNQCTQKEGKHKSIHNYKNSTVYMTLKVLTGELQVHKNNKIVKHIIYKQNKKFNEKNLKYIKNNQIKWLDQELCASLFYDLVKTMKKRQ